GFVLAASACLPRVNQPSDAVDGDVADVVDLGGGMRPGGAPRAPLHGATQDVPVETLVPTYLGTSIDSLSPQTQVLPMPMMHSSTAVGDAAFSSCGHRNINADSI